MTNLAVMNLCELCPEYDPFGRPFDPFLRPFRPNALWLSAEVFVVGTNPARPIGPKDCTYERFIGSLKGNNEDFQEIYAVKGISETTSRVNELLKAIDAKTMFNGDMSANVLITNVYWTPTASRVHLRKWQKDASRFLALVSCVKPRVIFVHGKPAATAISSDELTVDITTPIVEQSWTIALPGAPYGTDVFAYPHFSGLGWPKGFKSHPDDMDRLAVRISTSFLKSFGEHRQA